MKCTTVFREREKKRKKKQDLSRETFLETTTWKTEKIDLYCEDGRWMNLVYGNNK
jgi:hypothetical protein